MTTNTQHLPRLADTEFVSLLRKPSAYAPLVMSIAALTLIGAAVAGWMPVRPAPSAGRADEGTAARVFQLLMLLQLPFIGVFAGRWLPRAPRPAVRVLLWQAGAACVALATIVCLEW
jgi:hypothetical protein